MRKFTFLFLFIALSSFVVAQTQIIEDFEDPNDTTYWPVVAGDNATALTKADITYQSTNSVEGGALTLDWVAENTESWGGFVKIEHYAPDAEMYNWSAYDTVSFWYYNETPQSTPGDVHLRFNLYEASEVDDTVSSSNDMEFYYSFLYNVLDDSTSQWQKVSIPLIAGGYWGGEGFNRTGWSGIAGNEQFDTDRIKGFCFEFSIGGGGEGNNSGGTIIFDHMELSGLAEKSIIFFNGAVVPPSVALSDPWGGNAFEVSDEEAVLEGTNSIKWSTSPNDWATWSGANFGLNQIADYEYHWSLDTFKMAIKAPSDLGDLKLVFLDDDTGEEGDLMFEAGYMLPAADMGYDGNWKEIAVPLRDFNRFDGGYDGTGTAPGEMDSTRIKEFRILLADGTSFNKVIYLDNVWVGNPAFDVVPPEAPTSVSAVGGTYQNLITWIDTPNEDESVYNVLFSTSPITSLDDEGIEYVATGIGAGIQLATHVITAPVEDTDVTYYYTVYCVDGAANESPLVSTSAITNTAKGVTAILPEAPVAFAADGNLGEWADIAPFRMFPSDGSGTIVTNQVIDGDDDLSLNAYVAFDADYIYFAADVTDDINEFDLSKSSYLVDCVDLFLGLYDWHGESHVAYQKGDETDYHFRFSSNQMIIDNFGGMVIDSLGVNYSFTEKFPTGYVIEAKISLDDLAAGDDVERFHPVVGMRIPIDYSINDADATGEREGILTYSKINEDLSWGNVSLWTHTWIGDKMTGLGDDNLSVNAYGLSQNYPNPFNPSTVISYSLAKAGMVSLKVFNILGQEVMNLVNTNQNIGQYQVKFDASQLSTGLYIYRIQAGNFVDSKKMMLLK